VFRQPFTPEEREAIAPVPFAETDLRECERTDVLFPGRPSIRQPLRRWILPGLARRSVRRRTLLRGSPWRRCWHLQRLGPLPGLVPDINEQQRGRLGRSLRQLACGFPTRTSCRWRSNSSPPGSCGTRFAATEPPTYHFRCRDLARDGNRVSINARIARA
jgi:hypothetical protein